jgi:type 1 glutamine amidotransferase
MNRLLLALSVLLVLGQGAPVVAEEAAVARILYITTTAGFHHSACEYSIPVIQKMAEESGMFEVVCSDKTDLINPEDLKKFDAICFSNTTGDLNQFPLSEANRNALIEAVRGGKAFIGIHAATDTYKDWAPYYEMIGGSFMGHPWHEPIKIVIEDPSHPAAKDVPSPWVISDEIYTFKNYSREDTHVIMSLSRDSFKGKGNREDNDYALAWSKMYGDGRVFYTALGHDHEVWDSPLFQQHLLGGIAWALGKAEAVLSPGHARLEAPVEPIFDGKTLNWGEDWAVSGGADYRGHWTVQPGGVLQGFSEKDSSHLFFIKKPFRNFEARSEIMISDTGNSGWYFRCPKDRNYDPATGIWRNWPFGYEAQINNGSGDPKRSGTFYPEPTLWDADIQRVLGYDHEKDDPNFWFAMTIIAVGDHIVIKLNDQVVVDHFVDKKEKVYEGYFAFQNHHPGTVVKFRNMQVRPLGDDLK